MILEQHYIIIISLLDYNTNNESLVTIKALCYAFTLYLYSKQKKEEIDVNNFYFLAIKHVINKISKKIKIYIIPFYI
jgi:hypothetical protein